MKLEAIMDYNTFNIILTAIMTLLLLFISFKRFVLFLHMIQLEGYMNDRFLLWLKKNPSWLFRVTNIKNPKKGLVFTARATRLSLFFTVLFLSTSTGAFFLMSHTPSLIASLFLLTFSVPFMLLLSNILIYPLEYSINRYYYNDGRRKLREYKTKVIGITGSYGKTSTKDILATILGAKYNVLKTPGSYNTPMGITKVIRGDLKPDHQFFIVEMGAKEKGNIKELCDLVNPQIGIITSIGPQHLETFRSVENIMETKYELISSLGEKGIAIFNNDNEYCRELAQRTGDKKVLMYGMKDEESKLYLRAEDISVSKDGIRFLTQNSKGGAIPFQCSLFGRHNVSNILAASTAAMALGMTLDEIAEAVKSLSPSPHRLNIFQGTGGVTIIDDAFNSNPVGASMALEVLGEFNEGRRVLVTPGFVEMGEREYEENRRLGSLASKVCDFVFLVGPKRTRAIYEGLKESGFNESRIYVEKNLKGVTESFAEVLKSGDIILFENDLPDNYNE